MDPMLSDQDDGLDPLAFGKPFDLCQQPVLRTPYTVCGHRLDAHHPRDGCTVSGCRCYVSHGCYRPESD